MSKRHRDALAISDGAVNISGMAYSLIDACKECFEYNIPLHKDAAVKLIIHQMSFIAEISTGADDWKSVYDNSPMTYHEARMICRRAVSRDDDLRARVLHNLPLTLRPITRAQRTALLRIYNRQQNGDKPLDQTYRQFRKTAHSSFDCVMVPFCGMWLGIEKDGHTHS